MSSRGIISDIEDDSPSELTIEIIAQYETAAEIVNKTLLAILQESAPGRHVADLCENGDQMLKKEVFISVFQIFTTFHKMISYIWF